MMNQFILSCCSTVDMPYDYVTGRNIAVLHYSYVMGEQTYVDEMGRDPEALPLFYRRLREGGLPSTSQINVAQYMDYFTELLNKRDVLHITFTSGLTGSVSNAMLAAQEVRGRFPDRKLVVLDSLCASTGYGLLVDMVADLRDAGKTLEECAAWTMAHRTRVHHMFFSSDMTQFRRTGRVSGPTAAVATVLNICPLMYIDPTGHIIAYSKARGKKKAAEVLVQFMAEHAEDGLRYSGKCFVNHSRCPEDAALLVSLVEEKFPQLKGQIRVCDIGCIIGSHTGINTVSLFFVGDERPVLV